MSDSKRLIRNTITIFCGTAGAKLLAIVLVTVYTYYVSTEEIGYYDLVITGAQLLRPIITLSLFEALLRWMLDKRFKTEDVLKNTTIVLGVSILVFNLLYVCVVLVHGFENWFIILLIINLEGIYYCAQYATRGLKHTGIYAVQGIVYTVAMLLSSNIWVCHLRYGSRGLMYSVIFSDAIATLFMLVAQPAMRKFGQGKFDKGLQVEMIKYSVLLIPNAISWWGVNTSSRWIITIVLGASYNGIFAIACKFPTIVQTMSTIFYQAWQEQALSDDNTEKNAYYSRVFHTFYVFMFTCVLILIPATVIFIRLFMDASYSSAAQYVGILYIGSVFSALSSFFGVGYLHSRETIGAMMTTICGMAVSVIVCVAGIQSIGLYAACIAIMLANIVVYLIRMVQTKKYFIISIKWWEFLLLLGGCGISSFITARLSIEYIIIFLVFGIVMFMMLNLSLILKTIKMGVQYLRVSKVGTRSL